MGNASRLNLTPGDLTPALSGMKAVEIEHNGVIYLVDDQGNSIDLTQSSIVSQFFSARSTIWQSMVNNPTISIEWDEENRKESNFTHNAGSSDIIFNASGFIKISFKLNILNNASNSLINRTNKICQAWVNINNSIISQSIVYNVLTDKDNINSVGLPSMGILINAGDILSIQVQVIEKWENSPITEDYTTVGQNYITIKYT